jgi:hypothetical protein
MGGLGLRAGEMTIAGPNPKSPNPKSETNSNEEDSNGPNSGDPAVSDIHDFREANAELAAKRRKMRMKGLKDGAFLWSFEIGSRISDFDFPEAPAQGLLKP